MEDVTADRIAAELRALGLAEGQTAFVHSSLRSLGYVDGGAEAVVDALLAVLGPTGTLVVPTFTFSVIRQPDPVFDPERDPSEMGAISEAVRTRPSARRSRHPINSVAAIGPWAAEITADHGPAAWSCDGPLWKLNECDARILLLGVPYLRCSFFHVIEQLVQTSYRWWHEVDARRRDPDGVERAAPMRIFGPKAGFAGNDFNKIGALLEERGLVSIGVVGNAVARVVRARDALDVGVAEYRRDPLVFVQTAAELTALRDGVLAEERDNEKAVLDPALIYPKRR